MRPLGNLLDDAIPGRVRVVVLSYPVIYGIGLSRDKTLDLGLSDRTKIELNQYTIFIVYISHCRA